MLNKGKIKLLTILFVVVLIILIMYLSINNSKNNLEEIKDESNIKEEVNDNINIQYKIYSGKNSSIKLVIVSNVGIDKIVYPDGQIGEFNSKKKIETYYNITKNGEYLFIITDANGKEIEKKIIVDNLNEEKSDDEVEDEKVEENLNKDINADIKNDQTKDNTSSTKSNNNSNSTSGSKSTSSTNSNSSNTTNSTNNSNKSSNGNNNSNSNNVTKEDRVTGTIYFNKPVGWSNVYIYITSNENSVVGSWPGKTGRLVDDNTYAFDITESMGNVNNLKIQFNNGKYYKSPNINFSGYNKLYNITLGALSAGYGKGEWIDYNENTIISGGPVNNNQIKNVIFMIGDGMGENHIKAAQIYSGSNLTIQSSSFYNTYVSTYSKSDFVTDSAASATALATGTKTINYYVGIDYYDNELETLAEYAHKKGLKTGLVATQMINHATPAGFSAHDYNRSNYESITLDQIRSGIDLMIGGGSNYFNTATTLELMNNNNYRYITNFSDIYNIDYNTKVIGTFSPGSFHETQNSVPSLTEMTEVALNRLESGDNGFFLMIEGSNIDSYSHNNDLENMIIEMIEFDKAIAVAKNYVDTHSDTLLVITADHETGGLELNDATNRSSLLNNALFTSSTSTTSKPHTASFVKVYTYGRSAYDLTTPSLIDNTYIHNYIKQGLINKYGY